MIEVSSSKIDSNLITENTNSFKDEEKGPSSVLNLNCIRKTFGNLVSVDNITLSLNSDNIYVLLGHNGAGKTTLLNMIAGILNPDSGEINLDNVDILKNKEFLHKNLSICSQEDIFFNHLTVEEHIKLYSDLKGENSDYIGLLRDIEMEKIKDSFPPNLSGGDKRKLSICLSLVGNSKLILLDEPSSGLDVDSRRKIYKFLKDNKKDKIVILTTHFLEEAEILGDKIIIMREGKLVCVGSPAFLKDHFNCGYNISLLFEHQNLSNPREAKANFVNEIKKVEDDFIIKNISLESLVISFSEMNVKIQKILKLLDDNEFKEKFSILNYSVTTTSLEDVFLKVTSNEFSKSLFELKDDVQDTYYARSGEINQLAPDTKLSKFSMEFKTNLARLNLSLYRNKTVFLLECFACSLIFLVFAIINKMEYTKFFSPQFLNLQNLITKSELNIYYDKQNVKLSKEEITDMFQIWGNKVSVLSTDEDTRNFPANHLNSALIKKAIFIKKFDPNFKSMEVRNIYDSSAEGYRYANTNLIIAAMLNKFYSINSIIIDKIGSLENGWASQYYRSDLIETAVFLIVASFVNFSGLLISSVVSDRVVT